MRRQEGRRETGARSFFVASIQVDPWSPSPGSTKGPRTHIKLLIVLFTTGRNLCIPSYPQYGGIADQMLISFFQRIVDHHLPFLPFSFYTLEMGDVLIIT